MQTILKFYIVSTLSNKISIRQQFSDQTHAVHTTKTGHFPNTTVILIHILNFFLKQEETYKTNTSIIR